MTGPEENRSGPSLPPECVNTRALATEAILDASEKALPEDAAAHVRRCPDCRGEILELNRMDSMVADALRTIRRSIPDPSPARIDSIMAGVSARSTQARLLGRFRRTVKWMLWIALLALSLLSLCVVLCWLIFRLLGRI